MQRIHQQFKAANQAKVDAQQELDTVKLQIDETENYNIRQVPEEKGTLE